MRSSTSFAILALLASAGSSFGAPVPKTCIAAKRNDSSVAHADGATVPVNAGNTDSVAAPITVNANTGNIDKTGLLPAGLDKSTKHLKTRQLARGLALGQPIGEDTVDDIPPVTGHSGVVNTKHVGGNDDALKDDKITLLPGTTSSGKNGVISGTTNNYGAHVLQTPGTDETLADVQAGNKSAGNNVDAKVQIPVADSVVSAAGGGASQVSKPVSTVESAAPSDKNGNVVSQLIGKPGKGNGIAEQPVLSVGAENNNPKPSPKSSPRPSQAHSSTAGPTQSDSSAAHPSTSQSVSHPSASPSPQPSASAASPSQPAPSQSASHSDAHPSASASPKPSQASQGNDDYTGVGYGNADNNGQNNGKPDDQNVGLYGPGAFDFSKGPKNGQGGNGKPTGPSRLGKQDGLKPAQTTFGSRPQHIVPCDGLFTHAAGDLVDMCIELDLLSSAPEHTTRCPDDMQHDLHAHLAPNDQNSKFNKETMNAKASKDIAQFVRLCIDAGVL